MRISIVIRTYNEQRHLDEVLKAIGEQDFACEVEVVVVDSGSTDDSRDIAARHGCRIVRIAKEEFTFGRSLNLGCEHASGEILAFLSGHCIPARPDWLSRLVAPIADAVVDYSYGRQIGGVNSRFSECRIFHKYFPEHSSIPQNGFFCNNANAALSRRCWVAAPFDESLTGLEDMAMAKRITESGGRIGYVAESVVYHLHDESWRAIRNRFEREAIALRSIMPQVHITYADFIRYWASSVLLDFGAALNERKLVSRAWEIVAYRYMQFRGSYCGNNEHRRLSRQMKDRYFYPV